MSVPTPDPAIALAFEGVAPPERPIVVEHREQLIYLLREAAELEHAIMCQYLFTAFTLKQTPDEGLTLPQVQAVNRWRGVLLQIAREEMLHLSLVENLLTSIGASPHLSRPNIPCPTHYFPPGVQIALIPFGERALRHFLYIERPEGMPLADAEGFAAVERAQPLVADEDIVPRAQDYAAQGHLYRAIDIGFAWLTARLGERGLFIGPPSAQATPASFGWPQLVPVVDLDSAHRALDTIVHQGEGARGDDWREAHFGRFLQVFNEFMALRQADPAFEPARPVLAGSTGHREAAGELPRISDPATARVADLFNVANEILLLALARFFAHTDESPEQLQTLAAVSVGLMFTAIKPLGQRLTTLPFGPTHPGFTAGPTFELFYRSGYLLPHREPAWLIMAERLRQAAEFGRLIEAESGIALAKVVDSLDKYADMLGTPPR